MKLKQILFGVLLSCSMLFSYSGYYAPFSGTKYILQGWKGKTSHGGHNPRYPYALDIVDKVSGTKFDVLAVKDGKVTSIGWDKGFGNYIIIKHNDGLYSEYVHLSKVYVTKNQSIQRGKIIGKSGSTGSYSKGVHLHLQFSTDGSPSHMGNTPYSKMVDFVEFSISAVENIDTSSRTYPFTSQNFIHEGSKGSIIDGAGSLVGAYDNIAGGNYDYALMQSHPNNSSTVVFQWLYDIDQCSQIDLFSYPNNLDVTIKTKKWNEHTIKEAFNVTLNKYNENDLSNGISLKRRNGDSDWTTLSVTSKEPLSSSNYIIAHCRDNSERYKDGNRQNITPTLVNLPNNYYWSGTASLISQIQNRNFEEAGVGIDYAVTYSGHKSFTTFQWYAGDNCRKIKIKGYDESKSNINEVAIKVWDDQEWTTKCTNSLPCTISAPKVPEYYIIKIRSNANDIKSGYIQTECVQ